MDPYNKFGAFYGGTREDLIRAYRDQGFGGMHSLYEHQRPQVDQAYVAWEQKRMEWEKLHRPACDRNDGSFPSEQREGREETISKLGNHEMTAGKVEREQEVCRTTWEGGSFIGTENTKNAVEVGTINGEESREHSTEKFDGESSNTYTNSHAKKALVQTNLIENDVNPKEEMSVDEDSLDLDEDELKWVNTAENNDDNFETEEFKTVAGFVYLNTWHLQPDLTIQYAIKFDTNAPPAGHKVQVADVFVNLDEAIKLLTCVSGQVKVKPPNIKTIWTITVGEEDLDFCPLTEFVYHAALKASGKKFKKVYEGILNEIIRNLYSSTDVAGDQNGNSIKEYTEKNYSVNDYFDGTGGNQKLQQVQIERKSKRKTDNFLGWSHMEEMLDKELSSHDNGVKVEVKLEPGSLDRDWEPYKNRKMKNVQEKIYDCNLCDKSYSKNIRLYKHQLQAHPHQPESHIEKPLSLVKHDEMVKMERSSGNKEGHMTTELENDNYTSPDRVGSFRCKSCNKPFIRLMILINHCRREHPDQPEICPEEPLKLGLLETLHERSSLKTSEGEIFTCGLSLCNLKFDRYLSLVDHERTHSEAFICILCGLCCYSAENLIGHSDQLHPRKSEFICRVCGFFNRKADSLKTHVQQEHMQGAVMFQCEECPYTTEKKQSLHNHKRTAHREQEFFCDICGKNYASGASLYVHKKSHDPDFKKFQCKLCPAKFAYSSGLSYHMAVHTGEKPFQCNQCGSNFGSHTALSRHIKVLHAEEKDMVFQCEHCGKKFPKRMGREYRDHIKVHTGERDHICSICGSGYFSRKMLRKHELKKHAHILPKKPQPIRINPENVPQLTVTPNAASAALQGSVGVS